MPSDIGLRLLRARLLSGASALELANLAALSRALVRHVETGLVKHPRADTLSAIARVLGVDLRWLIDGEGDPPTAEAVQAAVERARAAREAA